MEHFDKKGPIFLSVVGYLVELSVALLVLFHDYGNRDTAVIVSLLVVVYGMIKAHLWGMGAISATYFLELSKQIRQNAASDEQKDGERESVLAVLTRPGLPYMWAGAFFYVALAALAAIKLIATLL
jgi:hypothetical protein